MDLSRLLRIMLCGEFDKETDHMEDQKRVKKTR